MESMKTFQNSAILLVALVGIGAGTLAFGQASPTLHKWSDTPPGYPAGKTWDDAYADYVQRETTVDMFANGKHHIKGQEDCKEAAVLIRADYCIDHNLPCQFHTTDGRIVSNTSQLQNYRPGDSAEVRKAEFLTYLSRHVSVQTVSMDTYPIKIDRKNVVPGTVELYMKPGAAHTLTIQSVDSTGFVVSIYGTEQQSVIKNENTYFLFDGSGFSPESSHPYATGKDGLRKWRHYDEHPDVRTEPGYDDYDQYSSNFKQEKADGEMETWSDAVVRRIQLYPGTVGDKINNVANQLCHQVKVNRAIIIKSGQTLLDADRLARGPNYTMSPKSVEYDQSSTFSRDERLKGDVKYLDDLLASIQDDPDRDVIISEKDDILQNCTIRFGNGDVSQRMTLADFVDALRAGEVFSDPNATLAQKWGATGERFYSPLEADNNEVASSSGRRSSH